MCDYSLHHVASTPAKVGDKLVVSSFPGSSTRGFTAEGNPDVAVCLRPGTELAFESDVLCDRMIGLLPRRRINAHVARFNQLNMDRPHSHHDALEFPDGQVAMINDLALDQRATVLQLPAVPQEEEQGHTETQPAPTETVRDPLLIW
jgi:hypothetical protein